MAYDRGMSNTALAGSWIPDTSTFAARLALVRWKMGWNLKEASLACNLSQNSWQNWEEGASPRNYIENINRIVLATRVNKLWLMTGEGSPETPSLELSTSDYLAVVSMNDYRASKIAAHDAIHTDHDARVSQITVRATK
jgi:hypothetical protein